MKTTISLPVPTEARCIVSVGDHVHVGTVLAQSDASSPGVSIPLASLLGIRPDQITKYLKKGIQEPINTGDVIAYKRTFFSSSLVRSPHDGMIQEIDVVSGAIRIGGASSTPTSLVSPVKGVVTQVGDMIAVEVSGTSYKAKSGKGVMTYGSLLVLAGEQVDAFAVRDDVEDHIVLGTSFLDDAVMKLDALGAKGIIAREESVDSLLPWVRVDHAVYESLLGHKQATIVLLPEELHILVVHRT